MTTAIALQTSQGELSLALALGAVLVGISISISATVFALAAAREQREATKHDQGPSLLALAAAVAAIHCGQAAAQSIVLASTTSVESSGLLTKILPPFTAKRRDRRPCRRARHRQGARHRAARRRDLLLVHDPEAEQQFMAEGHGGTRRQIAWNEFHHRGPVSRSGACARR